MIRADQFTKAELVQVIHEILDAIYYDELTDRIDPNIMIKRNEQASFSALDVVTDIEDILGSWNLAPDKILDGNFKE